LYERQLIHREPVFDDLPVADSHDVGELQRDALLCRRDAVQLAVWVAANVFLVTT